MLRQPGSTETSNTLRHKASGVAHDFNNLLSVILGYCEVLQQQRDLPEAAQSVINEMRHAGDCAKRLTQSLLLLCQGQVLSPAAIDLNTILKQMLPLLASMVGDSIQIVTQLGKDLGAIEADAGEVEQVLMNLSINARDAMPEGGKIFIETANSDTDENANAGRFVTLMVKDDGVGMDAPTQARMFEPFFTTKIASGGTGVGLSTVQTIVQQSGGVISVDSMPGCGTRFSIRFPRRDAAPRTHEKRGALPVAGGTETILLVEDAVALRVLTRRILEDAGYAVLDTGDPFAALGIAQDHAGPLHLVITDVVLPGLSGFDLEARLATMRPGLRVLYASGYGNPRSTRAEAQTLLEKPFTREELLLTVRGLLDARPPGFRVVNSNGESATAVRALSRPRSA